MKQAFIKGMRDGIPIALGYFAVSAAYGMAAIVYGLTVSQAVMISLTSLTSAGQFSGTQLLAAGASFIEIAVTLLVINARYFLMSLSVSQRVPAKASMAARMVMAFGITDEIYAVAIGQKGEIRPSYFYGLMLLPVAGWTLGTAAGSLASSLLPQDIVNALGMAMYGMFIAIFMPAAKKNKAVALCVGLAVALSCLFSWIPVLNQISQGYVIVLVTLLCAGFCAWRFPKTDSVPDTQAEDSRHCGGCHE